MDEDPRRGCQEELITCLLRTQRRIYPLQTSNGSSVNGEAGRKLSPSEGVDLPSPSSSPSRERSETQLPELGAVLPRTLRGFHLPQHKYQRLPAKPPALSRLRSTSHSTFPDLTLHLSVAPCFIRPMEIGTGLKSEQELVTHYSIFERLTVS
jgi:hypothetical protein